MKTKITFEFENEQKTSIKVMRDGKQIGRLWSEQTEGSLTLPYPHNDISYCYNSIQICGFDRMSEIWGCGPFQGKKDCVVHFTPVSEQYYQDKMKRYQEYVLSFFDKTAHKVDLGNNDSIYVPDIKLKEDKHIGSMQSFDDWCRHNI